MRRLAVRALVMLWTTAACASEYGWIRAGQPARSQCGAVGAEWAQPSFDDRSWGEWAAPPDAGTPPDAGAPLGDGGAASCAGARYSRWRFDVGAELTHLTTVTLRIRYAHGFAAYLNGVEIARRRLDPGADAVAPATELHGPEWESVFVPVRAGLLRSAANLLAIEVHPRSPGHDPFVDVELGGADGPRIIRGPWLVRLGEHEVTVRFETDLPTWGAVEWGETDAYGHVESEPTARTRHGVRLALLGAGAVIHYRVLASPGPSLLASLAAGGGGIPSSPPTALVSAGATFHTPPPAGRPLRFVVYGDVRAPGHDVHATLDRAILDEDPDFILVTGDLVDIGSDEGDWEKFFEVGAPLLARIALFPAIGNHEYARLGRGLAAYLSLFREPDRPDDAYYSFDAAGAHFVALDSNQYRSPSQLAWLERDLAEARRRHAHGIFVYAHEAPYATGFHGDNPIAIHDYVPLFERFRVTLFFGGHDHHYERGRVGALDYVISGGGGAELRVPRCGVPGKRPCPPRVRALANEHHYVLVEVMPSFVRICPKRESGTPIEPCVTLPLR